MKVSIFSMFFLGAFLLVFQAGGQDTEHAQFTPHGQPILKIYSNFHLGISEGNNNIGFGIKRVYLGYKYQLSKEFQVEAKLDIGNPLEMSITSSSTRYVYVKNAYLKYHKGKFASYFGMINTMQYDFQQTFWAHRYIYKSFQDEYEFGPRADLGWVLIYDAADFLSLDLSVLNGEGYTKLQSDNTLKGGMGATLTVFKRVFIRVYYDVMVKEIAESTLASFIGYDHKNIFSIGLEYNFKFNEGYLEGQERNGYSVYGSWCFMPKFQVFGRYDFVKSNIPKDDHKPWNLKKDGAAVIAGVQYAPIKKVKIALDIQNWYPYLDYSITEAYLFLNLEYKL